MGEERAKAPEWESQEVVLPQEAVPDLADQLVAYLTEIDLTALPDVIGQVLDDFLEQCGVIPEELAGDSTFDEIVRCQAAVTLAYQLGRLEGRAPQVVRRLVEQAFEQWGQRRLEPSPQVTDQDLERPKELVYPRLRRLGFAPPEGHGGTGVA
jgi:hypothetical protein